MNPTTLPTSWLRRLLVGRPVPAGARPARRPALRRRAALALAVGAAAFAGLQLALAAAAEWSHWVRDPGYADKEVRLARRVRAAPGAPVVLMLGTSRTGYGFHAARVEAALAAELGRPVTAFNFGIPASGPVTHVTYLRRLLAAGHRPDVLLVEVLPPSLAVLPDGPLESKFLYGDRLRAAEADAAIGYGFPADKVREKRRTSVLLPWYGLRFPLVGRAFPSALPWHLRFDWSRTTDDHGWSTPVVAEVSPEQYREGLARAAGEYRAILHGYEPGGGAGRALADLLALARARGIPAKVVLLPESADFRAFYPPEAVDRLHAFLARACADHGADLVDARDWVPDAGFTDGHHMLRSGAEAFTDRLTREAVLPALRRPR